MTAGILRKLLSIIKFFIFSPLRLYCFFSQAFGMIFCIVCIVAFKEDDLAVAFEGNDKIKDDELLNEIQLRPRQVFSRTKVGSGTG